MAAPLVVAAAQTVPVRGDVAANREEHLRLVDAAAREGAGLLLFPELSLTGYELDLAASLGFTDDDARLDPLRDAAVRHGLALVVGAPATTDRGLCIGAFALLPDGTVALYTKRHLGTFSAAVNPGGPVPPPEPSIFVPGDRDPLLALDDRQAALAICADTGRAGHAARAAARGASLYLASAFVVPADLDGDSARLAGHARTHGMAVVFANFGGPTGGLPAAGGSAIWAPDGALLTRPAGRGPALVLAALPPDGAGRRRP